MRAPSRVLVLALLCAACGGGETTSPPSTQPPPNQPPVDTSRPPASIGVHAGDNQEAYPGTEVPVRPAAIVRDASGRPVAGVTVSFVVEQGGGVASGTTSTTGPDGVATVGSWRLGVTDGDNSLSARVTGLQPATFAARARTTTRVATDTAIGPTGGSVVVGGTGPWSGTRIEIPNGAFAGTGTWRLTITPGVAPPALPPGAVIVGPALVVATDRLRAGRLLTIRVPVTRVPGQVPVVLFHDPATGGVEVLPTLGGDAGNLVVGTTHLNAGLLWPAPGGFRMSRRPVVAGDGLFGVLQQASIPASALRQVGTSFNLGLDAFPIAEMGSYLFPGGHGPASALLSLLHKLIGTGPPLAQLVKPVSLPGFHVDSSQLAAVISIVRRFQSDGLKIAPVFNDIGVILDTVPEARRDSLADLNLRAMMAVSHLPQMMMTVTNFLQASVAGTSFAVATGATDAAVQYVDPVAPTQIKGLGFGGLPAFGKAFKVTVDAAILNGIGVVPLGISSIIPVEQFRDIVENMAARLVAPLATEAQLPGIVVELRNAANLDWQAFTDVLVSRSTEPEVRVRCLDCPNALPFGNEAGVQEAVAFDPASGTEKARSSSGGMMALKSIIGSLPSGSLARVLGGTLARVTGPGGILSRMLVPLDLPLRALRMRVSPDSQGVAPNAPASFNVLAAMPGTQGVIEWNFGDDTPVVTGAPGDTAVTHTFASEGTFTVEATLVQGGKRIARAAARVTVTDPNTWRLTSLSGSAPPWSPVSVGQVYQQLASFFGALAGNPAGRLQYDPATGRMVLRRDGPGGGLPTEVVTATTASSNCDVANASTNTGSANSGTISGTSVHTCVKAANRDLSSVIVRLSAQKSGDRLSGTITLEFTDFAGHVETEGVPPKVTTKFFIDTILEGRSVTWTFEAMRGPPP